uniref:Leukocyte receptor cluster member 8 homolog n=1 Tax=Schistocephalus solidus TaxID=70667 RepID=A0A0X3PX82_SCHSO
MAQEGWTYYPVWGAAPYQYYQSGPLPQTYDYNHQAVPPPADAAAETAKKPGTPPPPGLDQADTALSTPSNVSSYPSAVPAATPYMYPLYTPAYAGLSAVDAASRWNALNCSYVSSQPTATDSPQEVYPTTPVPGVQSKPFVSMSGPRFPLKDSGKTGGAASYTVYAGPKPQSAPSTATSPSSLSESAGGENRWSPELKEYVRRAFCSTDNDVEKNQMERILREKLEYVFRNKIQIDWTKEPIPTVPSKSLAAILAAGQSSSVNVVRPVSMQPRRPTRGRLGGPLPTGTLRQTAAQKKFTLPLYGSANFKNLPPSKSRTPSPVLRTKPSAKMSPNATNNGFRKRRISEARSSFSSSSSSSPQSRASSSSWKVADAKRHRRSPSPKRRNTKRWRGRRSRADSQDSSESTARSPAEPEVRRGGSSPRGGTPRSKARGARGGRTDNSNYPAAPSNNATPAQAVVRGGKRGGRGKKSQWSMAKEESSQFRLNQRANRFKEHLNDSTLTGAGSIAKSTSQLCLMSAGDKDDQLLDFHQFKVAGTSEELEKPYLRLTSAPDPSNVRPGEVLVRSLDHVLRRWKEKNDYHWVCEQLKSIRQDLIIQGIQTEFTAKVYEAHADIALDAGDFEEFHQCQSQLLRLHSENLGLARRLEFSAYRLLYYIFTLDFLGSSTILILAL